MKYLNYILSSLILLFVPIYGILTAVAAAIILDTYEICVLLLFVIDKYILNEFIFKWLSIDFMFTKICAILLIFIELVSIKENIEAAYNIKIWNLLKKAFLRAKEVKNNVDDLTK